MKSKLLLLVFALSTFGASSQTICDSVSIQPEFHINQSLDTVVFDTLTYTGQRDISYSTCYFLFPDTSKIDIKEIAVTNGISGPFTFTKWNGYQIIYNNPNIPDNTLVNAFYGVYHGGNPNPTIDCLLPVTFIINATTGMEPLYNQDSFSIFPNPFSSATTLQAIKNFKDATMTIYNLAGEKVKQIKNISGEKIILQRDNLPGGLYFIRVMQDHKTIVFNKLIISG